MLVFLVRLLRSNYLTGLMTAEVHRSVVMAYLAQAAASNDYVNEVASDLDDVVFQFPDALNDAEARDDSTKDEGYHEATAQAVMFDVILHGDFPITATSHTKSCLVPDQMHFLQTKAMYLLSLRLT